MAEEKTERAARQEKKRGEQWARLYNLVAAIADSREYQPLLKEEAHDLIRELRAPAVKTPREDEHTIHGGNVGRDRLPFYLFVGQPRPEYDQGESVIVWYDDLYNLAIRHDDIERALRGLAQGSQSAPCFCQMAIGNPMLREHSAACLAAAKALA